MDLRELAKNTLHEVQVLSSPTVRLQIILTALETAAGEGKKADWGYYLATPTELTSSLEATITDLRAQLESTRHGEANLAYDLQHCQMEHQKLSEELEQARKDGDRLDWLEANGDAQYIYEEGRPDMPWAVIRLQVEWNQDPITGTIRDAIDTTRQAGQKDL